MATVGLLLALTGVGVMGLGGLLGRVGNRHRERYTRLATTMPASTRPRELLLDESTDGEQIYRVGSAIVLLGFALAVAATLQLVS